MGKQLAVAAVWALLATPLAISVYRSGREGDRTFMWDPSSHALNGLRLADGITRGDPLEFFRELLFPHHYPPVHSLLQTPFYLVMGRTRDAARMTSAAALLALAALAVFAARKCGADPVFGPLIILAAMASSPHLLACAAVPMLEIFGGLVFLLFALLYARSLEAPEDRRRAYAAGAGATVVFLTAVNFAVILFASIVLYETIRGDLREAWRPVREFFRGYRPFNLFVGAATVSLLCALWVHLTGGFQTSWIKLTGALAPISVAAGILALHFAWELWKRREAVRRWPARLKGFFWATLVPIATWLVIYPPRLRITLGFLQGAPTRMPFWEKMGYYPLHWIGDYHLSGAVGILCVLTLASVLATWKRQKEPARFVAVLAVVGTLALFAHGMRDLRFFVALLPLYWVLLASEIARISGTLWLVRGLAAMLLVGSTYGAWEFHDRDLGPRIASTWYSEPGMAAALRFIGDEAAAAPSSVRVYGTFEGLSWHSVEFELRARRSLRGFAFEIDQDDPFKDKKAPREVFDRWLAGNPEERVLTIELGPGFEPASPAWGVVRDYAAILDSCSRYRLARDEPFPLRGLRVRVWDRVDRP